MTHVCALALDTTHLEAQDVGIVAHELAQQVLPPVAPTEHPGGAVEQLPLQSIGKKGVKIRNTARNTIPEAMLRIQPENLACLGLEHEAYRLFTTRSVAQ